MKFCEVVSFRALKIEITIRVHSTGWEQCATKSKILTAMAPTTLSENEHREQVELEIWIVQKNMFLLMKIVREVKMSYLIIMPKNVFLFRIIPPISSSSLSHLHKPWKVKCQGVWVKAQRDSYISLIIRAIVLHF